MILDKILNKKGKRGFYAVTLLLLTVILFFGNLYTLVIWGFPLRIVFGVILLVIIYDFVSDKLI